MNFTISRDSGDKNGTFADRCRHNMTIRVAAALLFIAFGQSQAWAHPLEEAARIAVVLCQRVNALSIDQCGTGMAGSSLEHSAARMAVKHLFETRSAFVRECEAGPRPKRCIDQGDLLILSGMWEAEPHEVVHLPD